MAHRFTMVEISCDGPFEILSRRPHVLPFKEKVETSLRDLLNRWGVNVEPRCTIRAGGLKPIDVRVHGRSIDYPWGTLARLRSSVWEKADVGTIQTEAASVIERTLSQNPAAYLNAQQAAEYAGHAFGDQRTADSLGILRSLLWLGVSLEERSYIRERMRKAREMDTRPDELVESLFADLRGHVRVFTTESTRSELTGSEASEVDARSDACRPDVRQELEDLERQLYLTIGVQLPDVTVTTDPGLPAGTMAVQTNSYREPPVPVGDAPLGPTLIPILQRSAHRLLGIQDVESQLAELQTTSPELVQAAIGRISSAQLTRTLREMLRDSLSIRDLRAILDRLLCFETITIEAGQQHICDDRLPILSGANLPPAVRYLDFIRLGLKHRLVRDHVEGHLIVSVDGAAQTRLENGLRRRSWPNDRQLRTMKDSLGSEITRWGGRMPVTMVVRSTIRWHVRRMLAGEFPDVAVLAASEVPTEAALRPAFTIGSTGRGDGTGGADGSGRRKRSASEATVGRPA